MARYVQCDMCQKEYSESDSEVLKVTLTSERINIPGKDLIVESVTRDLCRECMIPIIYTFKDVYPLVKK